MMQFVRNFGRLLVVMLLINILLIVILGMSGTWGRWADALSDRRDMQRGGLLENMMEEVASSREPILSEPLPQEDDGQALITQLQGEPDWTIAARLVEVATSFAPLPKPATFFMPTDSAFALLPPPSVDALLSNPEAAHQLIRHHAAAGILPVQRLSQMPNVPLITGEMLSVYNDGQLEIGGGDVISADIAHPGGLLHKVARVLLPTGNVAIDTPDGVTEIDYTGDFLTINGAGEPNMYIILQDGNTTFGRALVNAEGRWSLSGDLTSGRHEFVAYLVQPVDSMPIEASIPIILNKE